MNDQLTHHPSIDSLRGVLYDLDGVLINSARAWYHVVVRGVELCGRPPITWEDFIPTFGQGIETDRTEFFPNWSAEQISVFYEKTFREEIAAIEIMDGALTVLDQCHARGLKQAVVTNTPRPLAQRVLEAKGFTPYLEVLAAAGEAAEKPAPDLLFLALKRLGLKKHEVIYIGDSNIDVAAAKAAQVRMAGLGIAADLQLRNLHDLVHLVAN